jgi:hypothetical protein
VSTLLSDEDVFGETPSAIPAPPPAAAPRLLTDDEVIGNTSGGFRAAVSSGVDNLQAGYGSAVEGLGRVIGSDTLRDYGAEVAERNNREAAESGAGLMSVYDVDSLGSAGRYASEALGQNAAQLGVSMAGGYAGMKTGAAAGAAIGSVVPGLGTAAGGVLGGVVGGFLGGMAVNVPYFYGSHRERQREANEAAGNGAEINEGTAFLTALPAAALDTIVDRLLLNPIFRPLAVAGGGIFTRVSRDAATGAVREVPTELGQTVIERAQAGLDLLSDDRRYFRRRCRRPDRRGNTPGHAQRRAGHRRHHHRTRRGRSSRSIAPPAERR